MATRNRTNLYISYRQSYAHHPTQSYSNFNAASTEELDTLISHNRADAAIEMDILPPAWADTTQQVDEILSNITKMSAKLDKLHARHVLPGFDDKSEEEGEIERLTSEITKLFHDCQRHIKEVQRNAKGLDGTDAIMAKNIQISLATKVQESSTQFRKKQSAYLRRLGGNERASTPSFLDDTSAPDYDVSISQTALRQQQQTQRRTNDAAIQQREREIEDIAKGIIELSEIFKELQTMVIDQGTMLDRIDYNVELARDRVKDAHVDLGQASTYQKRTRKRMIMLLLFLVILLLLVILVTKPLRRGESDSTRVAVPETQDGVQDAVRRIASEHLQLRRISY